MVVDTSGVYGMVVVFSVKAAVIVISSVVAGLSVVLSVVIWGDYSLVCLI